MKRRVTDTIIAQPAIFTIEYALAQLWMTWGIRPRSMLGHSIGEYVAACQAGVFSLADALTLVATRGRLMQQIPAGGMLSVRLPEKELRHRLNAALSLAAVNSPSLCVVAGPLEALRDFEEDLKHENIATRSLATSHAFHSTMMDPIIQPFTDVVAHVRLNPAQIPYLSSVTGTWITEQEATDPRYWARHAREPVKFSAAVSELRKDPDAVLLEVGPGIALSTLARQHAGTSAEQVIMSSLSDHLSDRDDESCLLKTLGSLWLAGVQPDWRAFHGEESRKRISLPTYPFERKRYWLELPAEKEATPTSTASFEREQSPVMDVELPKREERLPMNLASSGPIIAKAEGVSRTVRIRAALTEIFEELSGTDVATSDRSTTFLEMGFDSLFLTQVTQAIQVKFGLTVAFRQLLGDESTLDELTRYIDGRLPSTVFCEPTLPLVVGSASIAPAIVEQTSMLAAAATSLPLSHNSEFAIERLMHEQLEAIKDLFTKQLDTVRRVATPAEGTRPEGPAPSTAAASMPHTAVASISAATPAIVATPPANVQAEMSSHGPFRPMRNATPSDLTVVQLRHLNALIARHTKRTRTSKSMTEESRQPLADPRVVSGFRTEWKELVYPIITNRSHGARLWDVDGNEYIDLVNGFGSIMVGHRPEFVEQAIKEQLHKGFEIGPQTPLAGEVARLFCDMTGNERMTFCNTGSEAVMAALRVARTVTGRSKVVMFSGDYHGMFDEVLVKGFKSKAGLPQSAPVAPGIPRESVSNMIVLDYGTADSLDWIHRNATDLAAVLVEPVQSRHPGLQPVEFLNELRNITQAFGAALIFDEIVTGFRVHPGGCQALFGIRADLATYGKVVAGGMPIGILAGKAGFMDVLDGGMWRYADQSKPEIGVTFFAGTFVRHPLAVAATKAVLDHFKEQGPALQEKLTARTARLVDALNAFIDERRIPTRVESFGSIFY